MQSNMNTVPRQCPSCGAPLAAGVPEGLCPKCLLQRGPVVNRAGVGQRSVGGDDEQVRRGFHAVKMADVTGVVVKPSAIKAAA